VAVRRGRCGNFQRCSAADDRTVFDVPDDTAFQCPACGSELTRLGLTEQFPAAFLAFLIVQVLFFGFIAWRWAIGGPQKASSKTSGNVILRIAGSNTIGSSLGPALAEAFLKQLGAGEVRTQPGAAPEEKNVSGILPGASSPSVISIAAHGSATAFSGLADGKCDVGAASRKVKPDEAHALAFLGDMTSFASEHVLGLDGVAVIVNYGNPLSSLRADQVAQIFSGAVTDWSQVGGRPGSITVYARDDKSGTYDTFKTLILGSSTLVSTARRFEDSTQLSDSVAGDVNGVGFIGLPYIHSAKALAIATTGTRPLLPNLLTVATEDYPLSRRLLLYTPGNSQNKFVRPFIEFALSKAGQDIVANVGFVSQNIRLEQTSVPLDSPRGYKALTQDALRLSLDFRFRTGESDLDNKALVDLERTAAFFSDFRYRGDDILLLGFADNTGVRSRNMQLSLDRARKVNEEFERRGLKPSVVEGFGPDLPVASNATEDGREKNRRVEVWLRNASVIHQ
jgi:phosphate transport system substrate-binding protein